jgi:hypothetical protein
LMGILRTALSLGTALSAAASGMQVFALGIVSVFDQILDEMEADKRDALFKAYIKSFGEEPGEYRADADKLAELAEACSSVEDLIPAADGNKVCPEYLRCYGPS